MDHTHLYTTRPQKSVSDDLTEILATFKELLKDGKTAIKLVNYHQGLPLTFPAQIMGLEHGMLEVEIHPQQAVAIERDHVTFIRCDAFRQHIGVRVQYINVKKCAATLNGFFFIDIMADKRNSVRLTLDPPCNAAFGLNGSSVSGKLVDLSMTGMAIKVNQLPEIPEQHETTIKFSLPDITSGAEKNMETLARFVRSFASPEGHSLAFSIEPDRIVDQHISRYLFQRQVEIIQKLRDGC